MRRLTWLARYCIRTEEVSSTDNRVSDWFPVPLWYTNRCELIMERAGRVLGKMSLSRGGVTPEQLARSAWPLAVGKRIASRTGQITLVRQTLVVEVQDNVWQRQLFSLRGQILNKLH